MKTNAVVTAYFSPTGGTRRVLQQIAQGWLSHEVLPLREEDFTTPVRRQAPLVFSPEDLVLVGVPVYAGRVPNLLLPYLQTLQGNGALAVPVVLYGNRAFDDALMELTRLLEDCGFHPIAAAAFIGEHSFGRDLAKDRPDSQDCAHAIAFGDAIWQKRQEQGDCLSSPAVPGNWPLAPYYRPQGAGGAFIDIRKVKPETTEACINCGLCAQLCPMGSISPDDCRHIPHVCIKCNACVKSCPKEAKVFHDPAYLFHKNDITNRYCTPRKEPLWFL